MPFAIFLSRFTDGDAFYHFQNGRPIQILDIHVLADQLHPLFNFSFRKLRFLLLFTKQFQSLIQFGLLCDISVQKILKHLIWNSACALVFIQLLDHFFNSLMPLLCFMSLFVKVFCCLFLRLVHAAYQLLADSFTICISEYSVELNIFQDKGDKRVFLDIVLRAGYITVVGITAAAV